MSYGYHTYSVILTTSTSQVAADRAVEIVKAKRGREDTLEIISLSHVLLNPNESTPVWDILVLYRLTGPAFPI